MPINRREFLLGAMAASEAMMFGNGLLKGANKVSSAASSLPVHFKSGIEHIVVVMLENRSFDHLLGWLPGVNSWNRLSPPPSYFYTTDGKYYSPYPLGYGSASPTYTGCGFLDPDHSYSGGHQQYDSGGMDGFLETGSDPYAVGYYVEQDMPFLAELARHYTTVDNYFCSFLGPTFPNRIFIHAANTDRKTDTAVISFLPTIWDRLAGKGISRRYYYNNYSFLNLWGLKYASIQRLYDSTLFGDTFVNACKQGTLPAVSYVEPIFEPQSDDGTGTDDHPHASILRGDAWLSQTFNYVRNSPNWSSTVFIVTFDEWGGFFEHVVPPWVTKPQSSFYVDTYTSSSGEVLLGFRVPTIIASPWTLGDPTNPRVISSATGLFEHSSILKLIEWRWNLKPLSLRDASSQITNLAYALNWNSPPATSFPALPVLDMAPVEAC